MLNKDNNIFPLNDAETIAASGLPFLSNVYPSVVLKSVTLENSQEAGMNLKNEKETTDVEVSIDFSFTQNVKKKYDTDWWFLEKSGATQKLRVRSVVCFNPAYSELLSFLAQRTNEYQCEMMLTKDARGANTFLKSILGMQVNGTSLSRYVNDLGPFSVGKMTTALKKEESRTITYPKDSFLSGIVVIDFPALDSLERSSRGIPIVQMNETQGQASIKTFKFSVPKNQAIEHMSVFTFVYYDRDEIRPGKSRRKVYFPLQSGMGFIDSKVPIGARTRFQIQTTGAPLLGPLGKTNSQSEDAKILVDLRQTQAAEAIDLPQMVHDVNLDGLLSSLHKDPSQAPVIDVIKDRNYFSPLWISRDFTRDSANFIFSFDIKSFLIKNSSFPALYTKSLIADELLFGGKNIGPEEVAKIDYMCVKRRHVHYDKSVPFNDIGTMFRNRSYNPSDVFPEEILLVPEEIGGIFLEDSSQDQRNVKFYQGTDTCKESFKTQSMSKFQYGTKVCVSDPSLLFLQRVSDDISKMDKMTMKVFSTIKNSPPLLEMEQDTSRKGLIVSGKGLVDDFRQKRIIPLRLIGVDGQSAEGILRNIISEYVTYLSKFEVIPPLPPDSDPLETPIGQSLISLVNSPKVKNILKLSSYIKKLAFLIEKILGAELPKGSNTDGSVTPVNIETRGILQTKFVLLKQENFFADVFEYGKTYKMGYNYMSDDSNMLPMPSNGLPIYTKQFVLNRATEEFNKYFGTYQTGEQSPQTVVPFAGPYGDSSLRFFTPKTISSFGRTIVNQPIQINNEMNSAEYDIDRYAMMFLDIIKVRNQDKQHSPFYELPPAAPPDDLGALAISALALHDCRVKVGVDRQFTLPTPENKKAEVTTKEASRQEKGQLSPDLFQVFMGGLDDISQGVKDFVRDSDIPFKPKKFGLLSVKDELLAEKNNPSLSPIKLMFSILGEMEILKDSNMGNSGTRYENLTFNSLVNMSKNIKTTPENVQSLIEGRYSEIPNQFKSTFVLTNSAQRLNLGTGFDAVRFVSLDKDVSTVENMLTTVYPGDSFPPFNNVKDPMKVYAKFLTFWMNYKQIAVLEYLAGFENLGEEGIPGARVDSQDKRGLPIWRKFTVDFYNENINRTFLCRMRNLSSDDFDDENIRSQIPVDFVDLFDLPIYDRYFLLRGAEG